MYDYVIYIYIYTKITYVIPIIYIKYVFKKLFKIAILDYIYHYNIIP